MRTRYTYESKPFVGFDKLNELVTDLPRARLVDVPQIGGIPQVNAKWFKAIVSGDGSQIAAFVSSQYELVQHQTLGDEVVNFMQAHGMTGPDVHGSVSNLWPDMYVEAFDPRFQILVDGEKEDIHQMGFRFWNSYSGKRSLGIAVMSLRLVCLNGMVHWVKDMQTLQRHIGTVDIQEFYNEAWGYLQTQYDQMKEKILFLRSVVIPNIQATMSALNVGPRVKDDLLELGEDSTAHEWTAYDLYNVLTAKAKDLAPNAAIKYQRMAGKLLADPAKAILPLEVVAQ